MIIFRLNEGIYHDLGKYVRDRGGKLNIKDSIYIQSFSHFTSRDLTEDIKKLLDIIGVRYRWFNISPTGRSKRGGYFEVEKLHI